MTELEKACNENGMEIFCRYGANKRKPFSADMHPYRVTLKYKGRQLSTDFFTGAGWATEPGVADVLSCFLLDAACADNDFEGFCSDLGYSTDSREAERI